VPSCQSPGNGCRRTPSAGVGAAPLVGTLDLIDTTTDPDLAAFFLDRLELLAFQLESARDETARMVYSHTAFSTFLDCMDLGLEEEARHILERWQRVAVAGQSSRPPTRMPQRWLGYRFHRIKKCSQRVA